MPNRTALHVFVMLHVLIVATSIPVTLYLHSLIIVPMVARLDPAEQQIFVVMNLILLIPASLGLGWATIAAVREWKRRRSRVT